MASRKAIKAAMTDLMNDNPAFKVDAGTADLWLRKLDDIDDGTLTAAVDRWIRAGGKFWPRVSEIRDLAAEISAEKEGGERDYLRSWADALERRAYAGELDQDEWENLIGAFVAAERDHGAERMRERMALHIENVVE